MRLACKKEKEKKLQGRRDTRDEPVVQNHRKPGQHNLGEEKVPTLMSLNVFMLEDNSPGKEMI